ncbi:MAG TPA: UDP-N-acetylmuramoyl-L-alanyl-D-glutamate--2,6-diaminopimelate ligase [Steroidobacteraceae bacterium]|nr:UDP-N-acetylmuramoyl-L-alanyl-D-glutamate--2,6-diaminopimelate ligase [Steroidobacteraceae bacterium]
MTPGGAHPQPTARALPLATLTAGLIEAPSDVVVTDVTLDSRKVRPGALFLACRGATRHGMEFAEQAAAAGARAILYEESVAPTPATLAARSAEALFIASVPQLARHVGTIADRFFGSPSRYLSIAGVTGTNGKTTCAYLLAQALTHSGRRAGYMGTLGSGMPGALSPSGLTTADAVSVQRQLAELRELGTEWVGMEVSSHALEQGRVDAVRLRVAAFTNLTRDHLDYHGSMQTYGAAKQKLFEMRALAARVINIDDDFGRELAARLPDDGSLIITTRGEVRADAPEVLRTARFVRARKAQALPAALRFSVESSWGDAELAVPLIGDFNVDNILTVIALLCSFKVPLAQAATALAACRAAPGRMEMIEEHGVPVVAIVDYAHTPDALAKALQAARTHCAGRLLVVFGCGGDRDPGKRPLMGGVAAQLADEIVLTDDNPRSEPPARIVADILTGIGNRAAVRIEHDRERAICGALAGASAGDIVLIAGKGHEDYQLYGSERRRFSDERAARACLRTLQGRA